MALSDGEFSNQLAVAHNNQELKTQKSHNNPNSQTATINNSALDTLLVFFHISVARWLLCGKIITGTDYCQARIFERIYVEFYPCI